jgi:hypothetical protein
MMDRRLLKLRHRTKEQLNIQRPNLWELLRDLNQPKPLLTVPSFQSENVGIEIRFDVDGKRMRKVVRRSNYRMTGKYPSIKMDRMMQWESTHERNAFEILEACAIVTSYRDQPAEIRYLDEFDKERLHYPDILVELSSGSRGFLEIKPESDADDHEVLRRTDLLSKELHAQGYFYCLVTSHQIESKFYLANSQLLTTLSRQTKEPPPLEMIRHAFVGSSLLTFKALVEFIEPPKAKSWICRLVIAGWLEFDQSQLLNDETLIHWNKGV